MSFWTRHQIFEKNSIVLIAGILVVIAIGGLVEITPLFYLKSTIEKVDGTTANILIAASLAIGTPGFILFGWLSDKIGRKPIILGGCLIAAITYFPLFQGLTHYINPGLEAY